MFSVHQALPLIVMILCFTAPSFAQSTTQEKAKSNWPDILVIDDFQSGIDAWDNRGTGQISLGTGELPNARSLVWTAQDDGVGRIALRHLDRNKIDFSQYDFLFFHAKIDGKPLWSVNPIVQQTPLAFGYRANYYSVSTFDPSGAWHTYTQDLRRWANAWPDSYNPTLEQFEFEITQLAGAGHTRITIDRIWLAKSPVKLRRSYVGQWFYAPDGSQATTFDVQITNTSNRPVSLRAALDTPEQAAGFSVDISPSTLEIAAKQSATVRVRATIDKMTLAQQASYFGKTFQLSVRVHDIPDLSLQTELSAGTRPTTVSHPCILTTPSRMADLQSTYQDSAKRKSLDIGLLRIADMAEKLLTYEPQYPPLAATGRATDPITGGKLIKLDVPNLPYNIYQDPLSGRTYAGPLYDAGVLDWAQQHRRNAEVAQQLAMGYLVTGRRDMAQAAAAILREYGVRYLNLPIVASDASCSAGSEVSGAVRVGSTYMFERVWLTSLAVALDSIRPAGVFTDQEIDILARDLFEPSANLMMDHKVGLMNLQWMIQSAGLFAGLAVDRPSLVTRAMHSSHGVTKLLDSFLPDGLWMENPSYQTVTKLAAYPAILTAVNNSILPWSKRMEAILKAPYRMFGPDGRSPTLGTGVWASSTLDDDAVMAFSAHIRDPELVWIEHHRSPTRGPSLVAQLAIFRKVSPPLQTEQTRSPVPETTTHFPDYGGLAMRLPGTDQYCYFHYGRDLVHGHRNKLSINAYANGEWYVRNTMGGYQNNFKGFLETVASSNTIMIDGCNPDADTGELIFQKSAPGVELASAREIGAYKDVEHVRSLAMVAGALVVIDRCVSITEKTCDWLYHSSYTNLSLEEPNPTSAATKHLGNSELYKSLQWVGELPLQSRSLTWTRSDSSGLLQVFLPQGRLHVTKVETCFRPHQGVLWRQIGAEVGFASAFLPYRPGQRSEALLTEMEVRDASGQRVTIHDGQAVHLRLPKLQLTLLVNYTSKPLTAGDVTSSERMAFKLDTEQTSPR